MSRRGFLQSSAMIVGATTLCGWPVVAGAQRPSIAHFYRWFPEFRPPREIWIVPHVADVEGGMILESAAGLAALGVLQDAWDSLIYEEVQNAGYQRWFAAYCRANSPKLTHLSLDEVISRLLRANVVRGYHLFRFERSDRPLNSAGKLDESANVATSLVPAYKALAVSERLAGRMKNLGLKQLLDVRERTERWCLSQQEFSRRALGTADPKARDARALMIAVNAFVCSGQGEVYQKALARCNQDSPVIGWGCETEDKLTLPSSRWGLFQTATNWCDNLPVFASDVVGKSVSTNRLHARFPQHWSTLDWGDGFHYVSFTLSDGDNVQWIMGNFTSGSEASSYYGNPRRGSIPFTWGLPVPSLCQLSPRTLAEILAKATWNDDFIQWNGAGYYYPDFYGQARGTTKALELQAERLRAYMDLTGIRILAFNFQNWDGARAREACEIFASKLPGLLGIFAFQYYPYSAGKGAIRWVKGTAGDQVPIVSCRLTIWADTRRPRDTTPAGVAAYLNRLPTVGDLTTDECFSWVIAHAWSRFRQVKKNAPPDAEEIGVAQDESTPGTARGYEPVLWAVERLGPKARPVTAQELLLRVRLRLRPQATMSRWLAELEAQAKVEPASPDFARKVSEARALLARTSHDVGAARRCFELLKGIHEH